MTLNSEHKIVSLADQVFEKLEHDILVGNYRKGEVFTELKLAEILGVSRTPVREALRRLEQEGIIKMSTKGAVIVGISTEDISDIYEMRIRIEGYAARLAAERASDEEIKELFDVVDLQEFYIIKGDNDQTIACDSNFHSVLYRMSSSMPVHSTLSELHKKIVKFRKASIEQSERAKKSLGEHKAICGAIASHNGDLAEELTVAHIINARDNIMQKIAEGQTK
ncbi:MAG: GntR family transcriptional regulator [Clostridia bacterium]|nr:GntR family transcriptional regulator [Clostridia bacterium]